MGNYASCVMAGSASSKVVKVLFPGGELRTFKESVSAAELMLEMPSFFVVNARSLEAGRRFSALTADEDLSIGSLYVLFPMKKLNSIISASDMGALFLATKKKSKSRVVPEMIDVEENEAPEKTTFEEMAEDLGLPEFRHRRSLSRSKKPVLETIVEEL